VDGSGSASDLVEHFRSVYWVPGWEDGVERTAYDVSRRRERLTALGNAVVPQCAYVVGRMIVEAMRR
jgi:hypothetical protein